MYNTIWLINSTLSFYLIISHCEFFNRKKSGVKEELSNILSFHMTQLQQITVEEHIFGEFALANLTFGMCTSTTDTVPFTYEFLSLPSSNSHPLKCSPIYRVDNFQRFQRHIDILDNPCKRRGSHFRIPFTLQSSGDFPWCCVTEAHIPLLLSSFLPVYDVMAQNTMKTQTLQDVSIEAII